MITFYNMTDKDMLETVENGEMPESLLSKSQNVMAVFTQDWCPDWHARLERDLKKNENYDKDILVCVAIYNQSAHSEKIMEFKENIWQNGLIPYVRCYKDGKFVKGCNAMPFERIVRAFD